MTGGRIGVVRDLATVVAAVVLAAVPILLLVYGFSQPAAPAAPPPPRASSAAPAPAEPTPSVSPFTGLPTDPAGPVLAVKIDNAPPGRPQAGLDLADLLYVEPVESGLSRFVAVYQSRVPSVVGPVRSVRETDLELLAGLGRPALAFSGVAPQLRPLLAGAPVLDASPAQRPAAYRRDRGRPAPHNLFADPSRLRTGGTPPRDIGFRFGPVPAGGTPTSEVTAGYPRARIGAQWAPEQGRWLLSVDDAPLVATSGARVGATTVVVQRVPVRPTAIRDTVGEVSPFATTVGEGEAVVLRDGVAFDARWSRPAPDQGTTFTTREGAPLPFAPGPVCVVLLPA